LEFYFYYEGLPFDASIDMWSLGVILVELCIEKPLFMVANREELIRSICVEISPLSKARFSGGKFSYVLSNKSSSTTISLQNEPQLYDTPHLKCIEKLFERNLPKNSLRISSEFIHFVSGMLVSDPDHRVSPLEALKHSFLSPQINIPHCLFAAASKPHNLNSLLSSKKLRNKSKETKGSEFSIPVSKKLKN
jgi:serine/threonine protein kinase